MFKFMLFAVTLVSACKAVAQTQIPPVILQEIAEIEERFHIAVDQECPAGKCHPIGCQVMRFQTLDEQQSSSLPGLTTDGLTSNLQYRLNSALCEFAYEPDLNEQAIQALRQRIQQKVKKSGLNLQIRAQALSARLYDTNSSPAAKLADQASWQQSLWQALLPFIPWLLLIAALSLFIMSLIWSARRLGKPSEQKLEQLADAEGKSPQEEESKAARAEPSPAMIQSRIEQLQQVLQEDPKLVEQALKKCFSEGDYEELCHFIHHFGPDLLQMMKSKVEYQESISRLSQHYANFVWQATPLETWEFLERMERYITAAKLRIEQRSLEDEFQFLSHIEVEEFLGLLQELNEAEAIAALAYAPKKLRERFFAKAKPKMTARFIEQLVQLDRLSDYLVRATAAKLKTLYAEKGQGLKVAHLDRVPLIEQAVNTLDSSQRKALLHSIEKGNPDFIKAVASNIFIEESLLYISDELLTEAFLLPTPIEAASWFAQSEWRNEILSRLNPRLQNTIQSSIQKQIGLSSKLAELASEKIAAFMKEKQKQGLVDLSALYQRVMAHG